MVYIAACDDLVGLKETIEIFDPSTYTFSRIKIEISPIIAITSNKHRLFLSTGTEIYEWSLKEPTLLTDEIYMSNMWAFEEALYVEAYLNGTKVIKRIDSDYRPK